uniref:Uncharacterized protein n=1 Tax=Trypanosoma congolense (strain IL3000) TaxID=1068625 RepID=G0UU16_TRYCI|nr:hypothetical protein, unlikely [Trypanosoma congolense IL3000]
MRGGDKNAIIAAVVRGDCSPTGCATQNDNNRLARHQGNHISRSSTTSRALRWLCPSVPPPSTTQGPLLRGPTETVPQGALSRRSVREKLSWGCLAVARL